MIRNVIFDIGNVLVRWSPHEILRLTFGDDVDVDTWSQDIFQSELWDKLNRGLVTEQEAGQQFAYMLGVSEQQMEILFYYVKRTQCPLYGSVELVQDIKKAGYGVYALTDNLHDIVTFLKQQYTFWPLFDGAIVSAEEGCVKPGAQIFTTLFERYDLDPACCVFLDDAQKNIVGAQQVGMQGIVFEHAQQAREQLKALGLTF